MNFASAFVITGLTVKQIVVEAGRAILRWEMALRKDGTYLGLPATGRGLNSRLGVCADRKWARDAVDRGNGHPARDPPNWRTVFCDAWLLPESIEETCMR